MHHQKSNKNWKNQKNPPNVDWSGDGFVDGLFVSTQKENKNGKKTNYQIMERITLVWGKHKNGKNQLQKAGQTREKLEKKKQMPLRTWVPIRWVILFFWNGKKE